MSFLELTAGIEAAVGPVGVHPLAVRHTSGAPAHALRVSCDGRLVAYSGDTEWTEALIDAATGADLFICEAYFYDKPVPFHLDYATLMRHRDALTCHRLILTHMHSDMLARLDSLELETAYDGLTLTL